MCYYHLGETERAGQILHETRYTINICIVIYFFHLHKMSRYLLSTFLLNTFFLMRMQAHTSQIIQSDRKKPFLSFNFLLNDFFFLNILMSVRAPSRFIVRIFFLLCYILSLPEMGSCFVLLQEKIFWILFRIPTAVPHAF